MRTAISLAVLASALVAVPVAADPVAFVEDASANAPVKPFSHLQEGDVIRLGADAEITVGYIVSCIQEHARGGVLTIGRERGRVVGGTRTERKLDCGGGTADVSGERGELSAALVMRKGIKPEKSEPGKPPRIIASTGPVIAPWKAAASVRLTRIDRSEPSRTVALAGGAADLSALGIALVAGGVYRAEAGDASTTFGIAKDASAGGGPVLPRLVSF